MPPALQFDGVTKIYRKAISRRSVVALDRLSLTVERGEIFGFLGANAAGKTTAIHIAMGFTFASEGSGTLLGSPFGDIASKRRVGFLPENVPLHFRPADRIAGLLWRAQRNEQSRRSATGAPRRRGARTAGPGFARQ